MASNQENSGHCPCFQCDIHVGVGIDVNTRNGTWHAAYRVSDHWTSTMGYCFSLTTDIDAPSLPLHRSTISPIDRAASACCVAVRMGHIENNYVALPPRKIFSVLCLDSGNNIEPFDIPGYRNGHYKHYGNKNVIILHTAPLPSNQHHTGWL